MTDLINSVNKLFAIFFALALTLTGGINKIFNGDIYAFKSETAVIGLETLVRSQGVTTNGNSFIYSGKKALERVSLDGKTVLAVNTNAIPDELKEKYNSQHIGGISCCNGTVYAPLEDSKQWQHPVIALYDADTLEYTGKVYELPTQYQTRGVPWVIADGEHGVIYTGDSRNYSEIYRFDMETFEYIDTVSFGTEIQRIQGGEYYDGKLWFGTNDKTRACYTFDLETGEVEKLFDRIMYEYKYIDNFGGEGEDLTLLQLEDGTFIHTLQIGALFTDATLRHYEQPKN